MGMLSRVLWRGVRVVVDLSVVMLIFVLLPGVPPYTTYSSLERLPPPLPLEGALARNTKLNNAVRILDGKITGPESIASRKDEEIFVSLHGGKILRLWGPRFDHFKIVTSIGPGCDGPWQEELCGRPLGLRFAPDGKLLVADSYLGLFSLDVDTGEKEALFNISEAIDGAVPMLPNSVDIDKDGYIYWSDSSTVSHLCDSLIEILSDPTGRIIRFDPKTGTNSVLVKNIHFANGVQLSPDQDFLIFAETAGFKVYRHWLRGSKAGQTEVFADRLPGHPDNIRPKEGGGYYVALVSIPSKQTQQLGAPLRNLPLLRKLILRLMSVTKLLFQGLNKIYPNVYFEKLAYRTLHSETIVNMNLRNSNLSMVLELDEDGKIVDSLQGDNGRILKISETAKVGSNLFFGSPYNTYLGRLDLDPPSMEVEGQGVRMKDMESEGKADEETSKESKEDQIEEDETIPEEEKEEVQGKTEKKEEL